MWCLACNGHGLDSAGGFVPRLSDGEIERALQTLPNWQRDGDTIVRTITFPAFLDGIRFISRVADLAEAADHHPDIDIRYRKIRFALTSHDEGGLAERDLDLAQKIDQALP